MDRDNSHGRPSSRHDTLGSSADTDISTQLDLGGAANSPLFTTLPREIRDIIYEHVLTAPDGLNFEGIGLDLSSLTIYAHPSQPATIDLALNRVCRALRDETLHLVLKHNILQFKAPSQWPSAIEACNSHVFLLLIKGLAPSVHEHFLRRVTIFEVPGRYSGLDRAGRHFDNLLDSGKRIARLCRKAPRLKVHVTIDLGALLEESENAGYNDALYGPAWDRCVDWIHEHSVLKMTPGLVYRFEGPMVVLPEGCEDVLGRLDELGVPVHWFVRVKEKIEAINGCEWEPVGPPRRTLDVEERDYDDWY